MFPTTIPRLFAALLLSTGAMLTGCASDPSAQSSDERNPAGAPVVTIPPQPTVATPTPTVVAATPAPVVTGSVAPASPLPALAPVAAPAPAAAPATPATTAKASAPAPTKAPVPKTGPLVKGFYVNAGLFAVASNANNAYQKLEAAGLPVFTEIVKKKSGNLTRVRVGPYTTRAKAEAAVDKIKSLKLDAAVFKH